MLKRYVVVTEVCVAALTCYARGESRGVTRASARALEERTTL